MTFWIGFFVFLGAVLSPIQAGPVLPNALVARLLTQKVPTEGLLREFAAVTGLKSVSEGAGEAGAFIDPSGYRGTMHLVSVNLDEDPAQEILLLVGYGDPWLCVIKRMRGQYRLIYSDCLEWWAYSGSPMVQIINGASPRKTFSILRLEDKGTGCYDVRVHFYRILNGNVIQVLVLPQEIKNFWCGLPLHHQVTTSYFPASPDGLLVRFHSQFYVADTSSGPSDDQAFLDQTQEVCFEWDNPSCSYVPQLENTTVTQAQLKCLWTEFLTPNRFLEAFQKEVDELLAKGTFRQKQAVRTLQRWKPLERESMYEP